MRKAFLSVLLVVFCLIMSGCSGEFIDGIVSDVRDAVNSAVQSALPSPEIAPSVDAGNTDPSDVDWSAVISGSLAIDFSGLDDAAREKFIEEAKKEGCNISFNNDGSVVYSDDEGNAVRQEKDGTFSWQGDDGSFGQFGGEWPENEFTKQLPKPSFSLFVATSDDNEYTVAFTDATIDGVRGYADKLKASGFTIDVEITDESVLGMSVFTFNASNSNGYKAELSFALGFTGLTISK